MIYYKIRNKQNPELFVKGTPMYHSYNKTGRIFSTLGHLRTFLTGVMNDRCGSSNFSDWEIVELETVVKEVKEVHEVITTKRLVELLVK